MNLQVIGCSHRDSSLEVRERIAFSKRQTVAALSEFRRRFPATEAVLISTCNRTELFTAAAELEQVPSHHDIAEFLADFHGLDGQELFEDLFRCSGTEAIRHLFMVAASLDSMVVGEAQILSQVKEAYQLATENESVGQWTHAAFQEALRVAKRVARETSIQQRRVSIPSVAIRDFAQQIFERLDDKPVLLIGTGEMGEETLQYVIDMGATQITLVNRDPQKAAQLAERYGGQAQPWDTLEEHLVNADLVISTTGAEKPIVTLDRFRAIERKRYQRTLFVLDLAVPRDFEPQIGHCLGVYLYSLDDLKLACEANRRAREQELPQALKIIEEETERFMQQISRRATGPTIQRLKANADALRQAELERLLERLPDLDERGREEIEYAFHRLVNKLLHPPLESLRGEEPGASQQRLLDSLKRLFQIGDT